MKRYVIEFNTNDDKEVGKFIGELLGDENTVSLKVQVFTEEELYSSEENAKVTRTKPNIADRREKIFTLKKQGMRNSDIAKRLSVAANTVYNDLTYWRNEGYDI